MLRILCRLNTIFFLTPARYYFSQGISKQIQLLVSASNNIDFAIKLTRLQMQLTRQQLITVFNKFNLLQLKSEVRLQEHILRNICVTIQSSIESIHKDLQLSLKELQSLTQFLYFIRCNHLQESKYTKIITIFQYHFIKLFNSRTIKCNPTAQSIEYFCKSYVGLCSQLVGINYKIYNQICRQILAAINLATSGQINAININVLLEVLSLQSKKLQYSANEFQLHEEIIKLLEQRQHSMQQIQHIKLYQYKFFRKLGHANLNSQVKKEMVNFVSSVEQNKANYSALEYFISNFPSHSYEEFEKYYVRALNSYASKFQIEEFNGLYSVINLLKILISASKSRDIRRMLAKDNKEKIKVIMKKIMRGRLITAQNEQQYLKWFTNLISYQIIDHQTLDQLLPLILECPSFCNNLNVVYHLATVHVYHPSFLPLIAKLALPHNSILFSQEVQIQKTQFFQAAYLCAVYHENMHVLSKKDSMVAKNYERELAQILRKSSVIKQIAKRIISIEILDCSLSKTKKRELRRNFHKYYSHLYFEKLINSVDTKNILTFLQIAVEVSEADEISRICEKLKQSNLFNAKIIIKLIWHLYSQEGERHIFVNTILIINKNLTHFTHPNLQQDLLNQLILYLSDMKVIKSVQGFQSYYFQIVWTLAQTCYKNNFCNKKIESLIQYLLQIEPNTLFESFSYVHFISQLSEMASKITNKKTKKLILNNVLELNTKNNQASTFRDLMENLNHPYTKQLVRIQNSNSKKEQHKIPQETARQYPLLALMSSQITQGQLKILQVDILNKIQRLNCRSLFSCLFKFELPHFSDAYHLLFLKMIIKSLAQTARRFDDKCLTLGLKKLLQISKRKQQKKGEEVLTPNETEELKIEFRSEMQKLLEKVCIEQQRKIKQNILKINFLLQQHLLDLCFEYGVVHLTYFKQLLNYSIQNKQGQQNYSNVFKGISKLCVIRNSQYIKRIQLNISGCQQKQLYEMLAFSSSSFYIRKLMQSIKEIDHFILKYIERQSPMNIHIAQAKQLSKASSFIRMYPNNTQFKIIQSMINKQILRTGGKSNIITFNEGIKLIEVTNSITKNIYGIIAASQSKVSPTLMHCLQKMISKVCFSKIQNVYLCMQNSAEKLLEGRSEVKLGQFENLCRDECKYIYLD